MELTVFINGLQFWIPRHSSPRRKPHSPIFGARTLLSVRAIHAIGSSTVILVPTVQLLSQWYALLTKAFHMEIGLYFSGKQCVRSLTLTLYDEARDLMAEHGNTFEMLI
jgi:superfamily II DNA or RNA helicase